MKFKMSVLVVVTMISMLMSLLPAGVVSAEGAPSAVLDQSYEPASITLKTGQPAKAQTFTVGITGTLVRVDVEINRWAGAEADLLFDVRPTTGGVPVGDDAAALVSVRVPASQVPTADPPQGFFTIDLSSFALQVTAGQVLAIVLRSDPSVASYTWHGNGDGYPYGQNCVHAYYGEYYLGEDWADLAFRTFVVPPPAPPDWVELFSDPVGDQFEGAGPDIVGVDRADPAPGELAFRVRLASPMDYLTSWGMTLLDTDQDKATGNPETGAEYAVYVSAVMPGGTPSASPFATLLGWDTGISDWQPVKPLPLVAGSDYSFSLSLADLGGDDGNMDVMQVVGTFSPTGEPTPSDFAPDTGPPPPPPYWFEIIYDTVGDGMPDIISVEAFRTPDRVGFEVFYYATGGIYGMTLLDTDQDPATGMPVNDIGADYKVECTIASPATGNLFQWVGSAWAPLGPVAINVDSGTYWFKLLLTELGGDEGNMDVVQLIGTAPDAITDVAPDTGHRSIAEPPWSELIADTIGDGTPDILGVDAFVNPDRWKAAFRVRADGMDFADLLGNTYLDTDQDSTTGHPGPNDIGAEYKVEVFSGSLKGELWRWDAGAWVDDGPIGVFRGDGYYWFGLGAEQLGGDDLYMDVVQKLGTLTLETDIAPDSSHATIAPRTKEQSIADGIAWLVSQQNPDGSWGVSDFKLAKTALAVLKLNTWAKEQTPAIMPLDPANPYLANIQAGLEYIYSRSFVVNITPQPAGNPDSNSNGLGIYFNEPDAERPVEGHPTYNTAIVIMALAATAAPSEVVGAGYPITGMTLAEVAQDTVDYLAWGQTDFDFGRGGWDYTANFQPRGEHNPRSDESNSGWVTLGLAYAEAPLPHGFGLTIPGFVRSELEIWVDYIQNDPGPAGDPDDGGAGYTAPDEWVNILKTGNLLQQMAFLGDTPSEARVQAAIDYIVRHWNDTSLDSNGVPMLEHNYHAMYTLMKGLEALRVTEIGSPPFDWFQALVDVLLAEQLMDGSWPPSPFDDGEQILSTEWALLTLERAMPPTREGPDLTVIEKYEDWIDEGAGTYRLYFTIKNKGNLPAADGYQISVTVDADNPIILSGLALQPGESYPVTVEPLTLGGDEDIIEVAVDTTNVVVDELNELNNSVTNIWPKKPDLAVIGKHEEWAGEGIETYQVFFSIQNVGNCPIAAGHEVGLFIDGQPMGLKPVPFDLLPGDIWHDLFETPVILEGSSDTVVVKADATDMITEVDEANNELMNTWGIQVSGVNLSLQPVEGSVAVDQTFDVVIQAEAGTQQLTGVEVYVNFDPDKLEVVDTSDALGVQVIPGAALPTVLINSADNATGYIDYHAGMELIEPPDPPATPPSGTFTVATIRFRGKTVTTVPSTVYFSTAGSRMTYVDYGGADVTGMLSSGAYTVGEGADVTAPEVVGTDPASGAPAVPVNTTISANFSEAMNQAATEGAFSVSPDISGTFSWAGNVMTFDPAADLAYSTTYTVTIGTAAEDVAGNNLAAAHSWAFTTEEEPVGAHFYIEPSTQTVGVGQIFTVDIRVDASTQEVDSAGAYVNFSTTYLQVVNASGDVISGTANDVIVPGAITTTNLTTRTKNWIDNTNGYADISYGMPPGGTPANTSFILGTIRFKAMAEVENTALLFNTSGIRNTKAVRLGVVVTGNRIGGDVAISSAVLLRIQVNLQARPAAPNEQWIIPAEVWLHSPGAPWTEGENNGALFYFETQTDNQGVIELLVNPGTYDIRVKGFTTLKNMATGVDVYGATDVDLGTLIEGDINGDNLVDEIDYSTVVMCFGNEVGGAGAPPQTARCDFNNDALVDEIDYSIVVMNFGQYGADIE